MLPPLCSPHVRCNPPLSQPLLRALLAAGRCARAVPAERPALQGDVQGAPPRSPPCGLQPPASPGSSGAGHTAAGPALAPPCRAEAGWYIPDDRGAAVRQLQASGRQGPGLWLLQVGRCSACMLGVTSAAGGRAGRAASRGLGSLQQPSPMQPCCCSHIVNIGLVYRNEPWWVAVPARMCRAARLRPPAARSRCAFESEAHGSQAGTELHATWCPFDRCRYLAKQAQCRRSGALLPAGAGMGRAARPRARPAMPRHCHCAACLPAPACRFHARTWDLAA